MSATLLPLLCEHPHHRPLYRGHLPVPQRDAPSTHHTTFHTTQSASWSNALRLLHALQLSESCPMPHRRQRFVTITTPPSASAPLYSTPATCCTQQNRAVVEVVEGSGDDMSAISGISPHNFLHNLQSQLFHTLREIIHRLARPTATSHANVNAHINARTAPTCVVCLPAKPEGGEMGEEGSLQELQFPVFVRVAPRC